MLTRESFKNSIKPHYFKIFKGHLFQAFSQKMSTENQTERLNDEINSKNYNCSLEKALTNEVNKGKLQEVYPELPIPSVLLLLFLLHYLST